MKRKFFAAFLSLCMVMSLVPMTALAAEDVGTQEQETDTSCDGTNCNHVAAVGDLHYNTLQGAVDAGTEQAIILLQDVILTDGVEVDKHTTIDLNGHSIRASEKWTSDPTVDYLLAVKRGGDLTIKDTVGSGSITTTKIACAVKMTIKGETDPDTPAKLTVNGGTIQGQYYGISGNGTRHNTEVTINGGTITSTNGVAIYQPQDGIMTINGGTIQSNITGIEIRSGSLTVNNGTISGGTGTPDSDENGSGTTTSNTGIAVAQHTTDKTITVTINGGTITGGAAIYESNPQNNTENTAVTVSIADATLTGALKSSGFGTVTVDNATINGDVTKDGTGNMGITNSTITGNVTKDNDDSGSLGFMNSTIQGTVTAPENSIVYVNTSVDGENKNESGNHEAAVNGIPYATLSDAIANANDGETVTLLENADLKADITINKDITIDGQGQFKIDAQPEKSHAITVAPTTKLILKDVTLNITDEEEQTGTYGLNVQYGATLTLDNANVTLDGLSNATISSKPSTAGPEPGKFILKNSEITATNIGGNFSNGGDWILTNSTIEITNCASNGFSCNSATLDNSTVSVADADLMGVTAKDITLKNNSVVTVEQCGGDLPKESTWATDKESYKHPVEIKTDGTVAIDNTSSMVLQNNEKNNNTIYFVESTLDNDGTLQANVTTKASVGSFSVTVKDGSAVLSVATVERGTTYTLPAALSNYGYNHFVGWNDGTTTYDANTPVKIEKDTTFTAQWSYIPPANPNYKITIGAMENGTVTANPTAAKAGATVTLTPVPDEGYALSTLTVTDRFGDAVRVTENSDGTYTFPMPNGQVTVTATFVQVEEPAPTEPFIDVAEGDWFYDAVVYAYQNELMDGVGGNRFAPNSETTRAQLVTILYRLEGQPAVSGDLPFTDVEAGIWYTDAILWAAQNNIVNGVSDTEFAPGDDLTRQQLVTILYRYAEAKGYDVSASADLSGYPDAGQVQTYAQPAMAWAVAENIIQGMEDGTLKPAGNASRAQIATILMRFCEDVAQ